MTLGQSCTFLIWSRWTSVERPNGPPLHVQWGCFKDFQETCRQTLRSGFWYIHRDPRTGSHVYEMNTWLWNFGRPQPSVAGLSVAKTEKICKRCRGAAAKSAWETLSQLASKRAAQADDDIWHVYTWHIPLVSESCFVCVGVMPYA